MTCFRMDDNTIINTDKATETWEEEADWDGSNHISRATGSQWNHETLYRSSKGRYYIDDSNIIKFDPDRAPLRIRPAKFCQHKYVIVCQKSRSLECDVCGATIDPFDFMLQWAKEDKSLEYRRKLLQDDLKRLGEKLKRLRRMEKNAKARLVRLGVKPPKD